MGQVNQRRGMINGTSTNEGFVVITAEVPLSEMFDIQQICDRRLKVKVNLQWNSPVTMPVHATFKKIC